MRVLLFTIFVLGIGVSSCSKVEVPKNTPSCIKSKIRKIKKQTVQNPPAKVYSYALDGETVYYFPPRCCDVPSDLYDGNCNLICHPDGGFSGGGSGDCRGFSLDSTATLIWEDTREP